MAKTVEQIHLGIKLDGTNFPTWSKLMRINIGSREKLHHIEGEEDPPKYDDPKFKEWQAADFTVFSWIIQNMEPRLVTQFSQHQTTKALWKSLVTTFGVRAYPMQVYDLETKTGKVVQGNRTLEEYWTDLQDLWVNIESRKPCPYTCCEKGPVTYYKENETKKLYQFLRGLDDRYDGLRRELLKETPEPTAEAALGIMKQEEGRTHIWKPESNPAGIGSGFGARYDGSSAPPSQLHRQKAPTFPPPPPHRTSQPSNRGPSFNKTKIDKSKLICSHCGMPKHTKETCFHLVGFPDWWEDGHKGKSMARGRAVVGQENEPRRENPPAGSQEVAYAGGVGVRQEETPGTAGWWAGQATTSGANGDETTARASFVNGESHEGKGFGHFVPNSSSLQNLLKSPHALPATPQTCTYLENDPPQLTKCSSSPDYLQNKPRKKIIR